MCLDKLYLIRYNRIIIIERKWTKCRNQNMKSWNWRISFVSRCMRPRERWSVYIPPIWNHWGWLILNIWYFWCSLSRSEWQSGKSAKNYIWTTALFLPLLKTLEKNGFLTRQRSTADERTVLISLTDKGKELLEQLKEIPPKIGNCIPIDEKKALQLYILLYEILHEW